MSQIFPLPTPSPHAPAPTATIKRPIEIAIFSHDQNHAYVPNDSSLKYYHPPRLPSNLSAGFETFRHHEDQTDQHLNSLLETLMRKEKETGVKTRADFITWRGMMTKIMTALYDPYSAFSMKATKFQDTIFIEEDFRAKQQDRAAQEKQRRPPGALPLDLMSFWGYKFETLSVVSRPVAQMSREEIESRESEQVSNYAQFCSIVSTGFGSSSVVIGGEVDAILTSRPAVPSATEPISYVELKTMDSALLDDPSKHRKTELKLLNFWAQSFLLGIPKIIVGLRDPRGMLMRVVEFNTRNIPGEVQRMNRTWDGNWCIKFTSDFLAFLKSSIGEGVWQISKQKGERAIRLERLAEEGTGGIISPEFLEWRTQ
ncbi:putative Dhp1-interacting protein Din1 [Delitschia confertaspora ATCC 74209]|uniref:Decapping nuclease n=1 Tax=Delitschia confertaspora ATCC 74209 TaxID=1513339 RepID=A0A9P4MLL1_9PLEO|nr:putative Dhp1-interacting protein Din1 [Delitschia confertaspora ATCC 74209]